MEYLLDGTLTLCKCVVAKEADIDMWWHQWWSIHLNQENLLKIHTKIQIIKKKLEIFTSWVK